MLAYAVNTRPLGRSESPRALAFIVAGHALLLGVLFMSKTEVMRHIGEPIKVRLIPNPPKPPPYPVDEPATPTRPPTSNVDKPTILVPIPLPTPDLAKGPKVTELRPDIGPPYVPPIIRIQADPVRIAARFVTPDHLLRPPYPLSKLRGEEEASLRLRLTVDPRGRVTSVDPVGSADAEFLAAARRHILKAWRYRPATEDGVAVSSGVVITLSFRLNDA